MNSKVGKNHKGGYSLVEMLVSVAVFSLVMSMGIGSLLSMFDYNRKTRSMSVIMNDMNIALDSMTREIRFGHSYHCGDGGVEPGVTRVCPEGQDSLYFIDGDKTLGYYLSGNSIYRYDGGDGSQQKVTADEVVIDNLKFFVFSDVATDVSTQRARALVVVKGYLKNDIDTKFNLQTTIGQRGIY